MIKIEKVSDGYLAHVTSPHVQEEWKNLTPLSCSELVKELRSRGVHTTSISDAFYEADPNWSVSLRKPNSEYYREFRILFEAHEPALLPEFDETVKSSRPLEVFMWLESLRNTRKELWESMHPLLTDFFYSNH